METHLVLTPKKESQTRKIKLAEGIAANK
jgi:hypothetical protein